MQINTTKLFPIGHIFFCEDCPNGISISELTTLDSIVLETRDLQVLNEKLLYKDTLLLSDGANFFTIRENILIHIIHPSFKNL